MNTRDKIIHSLCFLSIFALAAMASAYQNAYIPASASVGDKQVVVIDAGHGGEDGGCVGINGCVEKDINLAIAQNLKQLLTLSGFQVVMTRDEDISIYDEGVTGLRNQKVSDMENRLEIIKSYPDCIFLSIHQNQFTEPEYFGAQMFYTTKNPGNFRLAQIMQDCFSELQPGNDREVKVIDNGLYLFKDTSQLALLIECGFLSNENDAANLNDPDYQKLVAFTIYKGLMKYLDGTRQADLEITEQVFVEGAGGKTEEPVRLQ